MKYNADATRASLLEAARDEFAEHGVAGGRVDRIAMRAGVNKQRIYGHFGNKELLFQAVMTAEIDERTEALGLPADDLGEFVGRVYDYHQKRPELLRLFMWEALHYGADSVTRNDPRIPGYEEKVETLAKEHHIEDTRRARALYLTLLGIGAWPHAVPQLRKLIYGGSTDGGDDSADDAGSGDPSGDTLREDVVALARQLTPDQDG